MTDTLPDVRGYRCSKCKTVRPEAEFAPSQQHNGGWCRECHRSYYRGKAPEPPAVCAHCDGEIPEEIRHGRRIYCSKSCKQAAGYLRDHPVVERVCAECGADITGRRADAMTCSDRCSQRQRMTPERHRGNNLRQKYGLTPEEYDELLARQGGRCAICRTEDGGDSRGYPFHVDHDHLSGANRALLCGRCNKGIGLLGDDPMLILAAAVYVLSHRYR